MRIREGDPLEIYTDREGEVIFKKYSPIGEMNSFAAQYAEALHRTADMCVVITDRDAVIAVSGAPKKSYADRSLSGAVEELGADADHFRRRYHRQRYLARRRSASYLRA